MSRHVQTNFTAADFMVGSTRDSAKPEKAPEADPNAVPEGTVEEITTWVGDDKSRAQRALDAENDSSRPRKTLVDELEGLLTEPDSEDSEDGEE